MDLFFLFLGRIILDFKMLRNCKVARVLPRIADCAKNDKNAVLRARFAIYLIGKGKKVDGIQPSI